MRLPHAVLSHWVLRVIMVGQFLYMGEVGDALIYQQSQENNHEQDKRDRSDLPIESYNPTLSQKLVQLYGWSPGRLASSGGAGPLRGPNLISSGWGGGK